MTLKVQFKGSLLEMKAWLAEMPDNLAAVFHASFEATTDPNDVKAPSFGVPSDTQVLTWYRGLSVIDHNAARVAAHPHIAAHAKISAIKAVRTVLGCGLKEAKFFVELEFPGRSSVDTPDL